MREADRREAQEYSRRNAKRKERFAKNDFGWQKSPRRAEKTERKERNEERKQRRRQEEEERRFKTEEKEQRKRQAQEERKRIEDKRFEKIERKQEVKQITANLQSLKRTYNEIQRIDPSDPRLRDLVKEIKRVRKEKR